MLFAEIEVTGDLITKLVSSLGVGGVLVWYLYHTTTKTIPILTDKYLESQQKISDSFTKSLESERTFRREETKAMRDFIESDGCKYNKDSHR